jgi:hypothetical protein
MQEGKKEIRIKTKSAPEKRVSKQAPAKKKKKSHEPADEILLLIQDLDPKTQTLLHRFSLRLQAQIARKAVSWLGIYGLVLTASLVINVIFFKNSIGLIAVDENGLLYDVASYGEVKWTDSKVIGFSHEAVENTFEINFLNFNAKLEKTANRYYTQSGGVSLEKAMQPVIASVKSQQATLYAESNGPGIVIARDPGVSWTVRKEYLITFIPAEGKPVTNKRTITTTVLRVDDFEGLKGLGIQQVVQGGV